MHVRKAQCQKKSNSFSLFQFVWYEYVTNLELMEPVHRLPSTSPFTRFPFSILFFFLHVSVFDPFISPFVSVTPSFIWTPSLFPRCLGQGAPAKREGERGQWWKDKTKSGEEKWGLILQTVGVMLAPVELKSSRSGSRAFISDFVNTKNL